MSNNAPASAENNTNTNNSNSVEVIAKALPVMHKGLQLFIMIEMVFTALIILSVVGAESQDGKTLVWAQLLYNPSCHYWLPILAFSAYALSCVLLRMVFPTHHLWLLRVGVTLSLCCLTLLVSLGAAYTVCDPMFRFVKDNSVGHVVYSSSTNTYVNYVHSNFLPSNFIFPNSHQMLDDQRLIWPASEFASLGPGWVLDSTQPSVIQCSSMTAYALSGRVMVILTVPTIMCAFLFSTSLHLFLKDNPFHSTTKAIILYCIVVVLVLGAASVVTINNATWDWRMLNMWLFAVVSSSYLSSSVVNMSAPPKLLPPLPSSTPTENRTSQHLLPTKIVAPVVASTSLVRAVWMTIQPVLAVEYLLDQMDEEDASTTEMGEVLA